jgi:hypothetical protein
MLTNAGKFVDARRNPQITKIDRGRRSRQLLAYRNFTVRPFDVTSALCSKNEWIWTRNGLDAVRLVWMLTRLDTGSSIWHRNYRPF